ncbi:MAG: PAS domain S-box protein [Alphaproteobacteria bacterium]
MARGAAFAELYLTFRITRLGDAIVTLISNLTERKLVEEQRKVGDAVRLALVEIPGMAGVTLSQFGRMTFVSKCFSKYSGFSAEELQDVRLTDIMTQHYKRSFTDCFERAIGETRPRRWMSAFLLKNGEQAEGHVFDRAIPAGGRRPGRRPCWSLSRAVHKAHFSGRGRPP